MRVRKYTIGKGRIKNIYILYFVILSLDCNGDCASKFFVVFFMTVGML